MKPFRILVLVLATTAVAAPLVAADFGVRAGRSNDTDQDFVGVELVYDLGAIQLNPNLEYSLEDNVTAGSANLDVTFGILQLGAAHPYLGAGVGLAYLDPDGPGATESNAVANLLGGVVVDAGLLKPYGQVKYTRRLENGSGSDISFAIGLRF